MTQLASVKTDSGTLLTRLYLLSFCCRRPRLGAKMPISMDCWAVNLCSFCWIMLIVRVHTGCRNKLLCCYRLMSSIELLKFVVMRSVFCANIAKIDQSGFHVKKNASSFLKGFLISKLFWTFFLFLVTTQCRLDINIALYIYILKLKIDETAAGWFRNDDIQMSGNIYVI